MTSVDWGLTNAFGPLMLLEGVLLTMFSSRAKLNAYRVLLRQVLALKIRQTHEFIAACNPAMAQYHATPAQFELNGMAMALRLLEPTDEIFDLEWAKKIEPPPEGWELYLRRPSELREMESLEEAGC